MVAEVRPEISVIIATYNRSNVLALTIRTVLWQTFPDWELIVVGDHCTDDTEDVVRGFPNPDHWRLPPDTEEIPYSFVRA
jgi:glycosyltransferase involved in cell wall biosynthesis